MPHLLIITVVIAVIFIVCLPFLRPYERLSYEEYRTTGAISFAKLSDGWTNYELAGDPAAAHTVVLIHGGTIPLCIWEPQRRPFLDAGFRVLRYDQYGRGLSDRPRTDYSRALFLRQLRELLDTLGIVAPVTLVGPSFGGAISVNFAAHYPERVRSMVLISPVLNLLNSVSPLAGPIRLIRIPVIGELFYNCIMRSKLISRGRALVPGGADSPCERTFIRQWRCKGTEPGIFSMFRGDACGDYRESTRTAGAGVAHILLMRGRNDREVTAAMIDEIRADLPGAEFFEIENSGHGPGTDAPELFNRLVIDYISRH